MAIRSTRRTFLRAAPIAAAVALTSSTTLLHAAGTVQPTPEPFQLLPAATIESKIQALQSKPGNDSLFAPKSLPVTIVLTTEEKKSAKEYEWHEGRDHIVQILEGATVYEVGGTPKDGRNTKPGEWLAPTAEGTTRMSLKKGDMLVIPRGTLHKRSTETSVTFTLISTTGTV